MSTVLKYASAVTSLLSSSASTAAKFATATTVGLGNTASTLYTAIKIKLGDTRVDSPIVRVDSPTIRVDGAL